EVPVVIVTAPGTDQADVDALRTSLARAGADLRATIGLTEGLAFADGTDDDLATLLELDDPSSAELATAVDVGLQAALAAAGAPLPVESPDGTGDGGAGEGSSTTLPPEDSTPPTTADPGPD